MTKNKNVKSQDIDDIDSIESEAAANEEEIEETASETDELAALAEENAKLKDAYLRACAESENTKKRCQQEIEKNANFALASFAKDLLPVADNLRRAITSVGEEQRQQYRSLLEGVEMTQNELTKVFAKFGIRKIESLDKVFDPNFEQVVQEIDDPSKLQAGYLINDRILREAMVIVTKGGKK